MNYSWILDSGGAGRGAWQGGVIYEFMRWSLEHDVYPLITMGASAGGYAAADVATGTNRTVMKGWTRWGTRVAPAFSGIKNRFRANLLNSIHYVMDTGELSGVFQEKPQRKLLIFTSRVRRRDGKPFKAADSFRYFLKSATRKLPFSLKYFPGGYSEDPVVYALNLPEELHSEYVRPLTRENYHAVIEASCLVPVAMGPPPATEKIALTRYPGDTGAVFIDGGYALKMPMRIFNEDARFTALAGWAAADKTIIFCCDPDGCLWETSSRLRELNSDPAVARAISENRLLVISPDHKIEAGFLCMDNTVAMRTFTRGREQAERLLASNSVRRFFGR